MSLSHDDVTEILRLLDDANYDEMTLETDRFTLKLKRGEGGWTQETEAVSSLKSQVASAAPESSRQAFDEPAPAEEGLLEVRAPMVGTFYRAPKPGADPFITEGSTVSDNTVIGIVEVMKLMNSVPAGLAGEVVEILAGDAQFVEKGQLLLRVRPS